MNWAVWPLGPSDGYVTVNIDRGRRQTRDHQFEGFARFEVGMVLDPANEVVRER